MVLSFQLLNDLCFLLFPSPTKINNMFLVPVKALFGRLPQFLEGKGFVMKLKLFLLSHIQLLESLFLCSLSLEKNLQIEISNCKESQIMVY